MAMTMGTVGDIEDKGELAEEVEVQEGDEEMEEVITGEVEAVPEGAEEVREAIEVAEEGVPTEVGENMMTRGRTTGRREKSGLKNSCSSKTDRKKELNESKKI